MIPADAGPAAPPAPEPQAAEAKGRTAVAIYDYSAQEDNELSFPDGAVIEDVKFPDDDWWQGTYQGHEGLFVRSSPIHFLAVSWHNTDVARATQPSNYVELQE